MQFTPEQAHAIERRKGELLLDAGAGSGKTTVLVERFARAVEEDGVDVGSILTITFTDKAASELRERIRTRLRAVGDDAAALATEGAWICTFHGFCARVLRAHALSAGLDPDFSVLDEHAADELQGRAFDLALTQLARGEQGAELISAHGPRALRAAITGTYAELRARGQLEPQLPPREQLLAVAQSEPSAGQLARELTGLAATALRELGAIKAPGKQAGEALLRLELVPQVLGAGVPWPGELEPLKLPNGSAKALKTDTCEAYRDALEQLQVAAARDHAVIARDALDELLGEYGTQYTALKRERSGLDFEDLELLTREVLSNKEIGRRYRERFARVMVDEMQDTNHVQLELIDLVAGLDLFMVGDAQQSIYGFRHADVELFEDRGVKLERIGARASLQTNFRSRAEILTAINGAFEAALGEGFRPLLPGREDRRVHEPLVELLIVDKDAIAAAETDSPTAAEGTTIWRLAEARVLARRVRQLIDAGDARAGEVVLLTRAGTDLGVYESALGEAGVPTYVIGGRGFWEQQQVLQLSCYLRALANPLDREAWQTTLLSPLCGLSLDGLVLVAADASDQLSEADRARLGRFEQWFAVERAASPRVGAEALLDRALAASGYDLVVSALPDGRRRLANVRKLMRLAREWEREGGTDLRGFVEHLRLRAAGGGARESEAPVESEALDAVRLMTIHRSKGLEFPVVCVADLGRKQSNAGGGLIRVGRDDHRLGIQIKRPGSGGRINALDYDELRAEQRELEAAEERRLFYVAMTRAKERLLMSGAATFSDWAEGNREAPIGWIGEAFVPDIGVRAHAAAAVAASAGGSMGAPPHVSRLGVRVTFVSRMPSPQPADEPAAPAQTTALPQAPAPAAQTEPRLRPLATLNYTSISTYERCGYRFYVERVLGIPKAPDAALAPSPETVDPGVTQPGLTPEDAAQRGTDIHQILAKLDYHRPMTPSGVDVGIRPLIANFIDSGTCDRLSGLADVRREQRFAFAFRGVVITGTFDVLARDPRGGGAGGALVVDYKSDRLGDATPEQLTNEHYSSQRTIYALAALRAGVPRVEVVHLFLEAADEPVSAIFTQADIPSLEADLADRVAGPLTGDFPVTERPNRRICGGCPARGGLCSWPLAATQL